MTVLDSFYLLFRTDAAGAAKKDIEELDKQITQLAAKGKKLTDEDVKNLKAISKERQELAKRLDEQSKQTENITNSFVKMTEAATGAVAAVISFGALKSGILNTAQFNSQLEIQAKNMDQNVGLLKSYGAAVQAAGGSLSGFSSTVSQVFGKAGALGQKVDIATYLRNVHNRVKGLTPAAAEFQFQREGIDFDPGLKALLRSSDEEFNRRIEEGKKLAALSDQDAKAAREFEAQWDKTISALDTLFGKIGSDILPVFTSFLKTTEEFFVYMQDHVPQAEALFVGLAASATALSAALVRLAASLAGLGASGAAGGLGILGRFGLIGLGAGAGYEAVKGVEALETGKPQGSLIEGGAQWLSDKILGAYDSLFGSTDKRPSGQILSDNARESYDFWISQGYSPEQASGIVANEQRESGFNPDAVGDSGKSKGIFQWDARRRAKIISRLGINPANASHKDQLKAAAWELEQTGIGAKLRQQTTAAGSAALFSDLFENPANGPTEALIRGGYANNIMSNYGNKSVAVKTGDIVVHTQATDADGISRDIGASLQKELNFTFSSLNDGISH